MQIRTRVGWSGEWKRRRRCGAAHYRSIMEGADLTAHILSALTAPETRKRDGMCSNTHRLFSIYVALEGIQNISDLKC